MHTDDPSFTCCFTYTHASPFFSLKALAVRESEAFANSRWTFSWVKPDTSSENIDFKELPCLERRDFLGKINHHIVHVGHDEFGKYKGWWGEPPHEHDVVLRAIGIHPVLVSYRGVCHRAEGRGV